MGATTEFRTIQSQHIQVSQAFVEQDRQQQLSFYFSMISFTLTILNGWKEVFYLSWIDQFIIHLAPKIVRPARVGSLQTQII